MGYAFKVAPPLAVHEKNFAATHQLLRDLRWECARVMSEVFPGDLRRYAMPLLPISTLSKWRRGYVCSALYRLDVGLVACWRAGGDRTQAQAAADHVQALVDRLYPPAAQDAPAIGPQRAA